MNDFAPRPSRSARIFTSVCPESILFTEDDIAREVKKCAAWLDERYQGAMPLAVSVLKGSVIFFCDLVRASPAVTV
mgnify:CR=1 FL=1